MVLMSKFSGFLFYCQFSFMWGILEKIAYQHVILRAFFEWVPLSDSGESCEVWVILREYFKSIYLFTQNGAWGNEKLSLKVHP